MSPFERYARGGVSEPPTVLAKLLASVPAVVEHGDVAIIADVGIGLALWRKSRKEARRMLRAMGARRIARQVAEMTLDALPVVLITSDGVALLGIETFPECNAMGGAA